MNAQNDYVILHPRVVRYAHWCWALGVIILIGSGWQIYNQEPIFEFWTFPSWATIGLGTWESAERVHNDIGLAGALLWHFAAMWLLFISVAVYTVYGVVPATSAASSPIWPRSGSGRHQGFLSGKLGATSAPATRAEAALWVRGASMILMLWSGLVL